MNWLKRRLRRWLQEEDCIEQPICATRGDVHSEPTLSFKIYNAIGGKVVEFSRYDRKSDRSSHDIYIIGKDEDFGQKIARIAMLEVLKD